MRSVGDGASYGDTRRTNRVHIRWEIACRVAEYGQVNAEAFAKGFASGRSRGEILAFSVGDAALVPVQRLVPQ